MLRQAISVLSVRVAGIVVAFAFLSFVSNLLSPDSLGSFLFAVTTVTLLHIVVICGANNEIIRLGVPIWQSQDLNAFRGLARQGVRLVSTLSSLALPGIACLYWLWPNQAVSRIAGHPQWFLVVLVGFALLVFSLRVLFADLARAAGRYRLSMASLSLLPNVVSLMLLGMLWIVLPATTELYVYAAWIAGLAATLFLLVFFLPIIHSGSEGSRPGSAAIGSAFDLFRPGSMTMLSHLLYQTAWHGGVLYVGFYFSAPDVALYAICLRLAELVALPGVIIPFLGQPVVAASEAGSGNRRVSDALQTLSTVALVPSVVLLIIFWFFGALLLYRFFGAAYADGALVLFLVAMGRCIDIAAGSAAQSVLLIRGNRKAVLMVNAATLVAFALFLPFLASRHALEGVGLALCFYFVARSVILAAVAKALEGVETWPTVSIARLARGLDFQHSNRELSERALSPKQAKRLRRL